MINEDNLNAFQSVCNLEITGLLKKKFVPYETKAYQTSSLSIQENYRIICSGEDLEIWIYGDELYLRYGKNDYNFERYDYDSEAEMLQDFLEKLELTLTENK
jgi:hypothetical protein